MFTGTGCKGFIVFLLAMAISLAGCDTQFQAKNEAEQQLDNQQQAVSLYVDAVMLDELNEKDKAMQKLETAIELDPKFALAYSLKGDMYQAAEQYEKSADAYEAATELDPWSFKDFFNLGKVAQIMDQYSRAVRAYVTACELEPEHYDAHINAAKCYYQVDDYDKAMEYGVVAKNLNPDAAAPELLFGDVFEAKEEHTKAIVAYRRALEIEGNKTEIMVPLAVAYLRMGQFPAAKELLLSVIEIESEHAMAHQYLGFVYLKTGLTDQAIASYETAARIDAADWMARKGLGVAYMLKSTTDNNDTFRQKALAQWEKSLVIRPDQPKLREMYARYKNQ